MIERSRVRIPAGTAGEFSSPGSTFCADSYFGIRSTPVLQAVLAASTETIKPTSGVSRPAVSRFGLAVRR